MRFAITAVVVLAGCSIQHRSQEFACGSDGTCTGSLAGRMCVDGYCVDQGGIDSGLPDSPTRVDGGMTDAGSGSGSGSGGNCPSTCTSCNGTTCEIDCSQTDCTTPITCPPGFACEVDCDVAGTCRAGINCTNATSCTITCSSTGTCHEITCGAGPCSVACTGQDSCHGIDCNDACSCDVTGCNPADTNSCINVSCTVANNNTCSLGGGCSSALPGCDTCP